jgi:hypothetical protein
MLEVYFHLFIFCESTYLFLYLQLLYLGMHTAEGVNGMHLCVRPQHKESKTRAVSENSQNLMDLEES